MEKENVNQDETWEDRYKKSKPLISYSIMYGLNMSKVMEILTAAIQGLDICEYQVEPTVLSRMPTIDRHDYEFPQGLQGFIYYEGYRISKIKKELEHVPLALTSGDSKRKFAMAWKFDENIRRYLCVLKNHMEEIEKQDKLAVEWLSSIFDPKSDWSSATTKNSETPRGNKNVLLEFLKNHTKEELCNDPDLFQNNEYYIPKCFVIVSEAPYFKEYKELLTELYYRTKKNISFPYDHYFRYITYEVPKPGRGTIVSFYTPFGKPINLENSKRDELPTVQTDMYWDVFTKQGYLSFDDNFLTVLYWFLCQVGSTVLISKVPTRLISLAETLRTIIFPFEYDDSYMPLISERDYGYLSAPFPLLIGVVAQTEEDVRDIEMSATEKSLLVYIDNDELKVKFSFDSLVTVKEFKKHSDEGKIY